jgi:light-regulated signal transduction histidine kinase (bacteriophytochrome)
LNEPVNLTNAIASRSRFPKSAQPFGFRFSLVSDFTICMASENAPDYLGANVGWLLQQPISGVLSADAVAAIRAPGACHVDTAASANQALKSIERASPSLPCSTSIAVQRAVCRWGTG